jgi:hypothetical protein
MQITAYPVRVDQVVWQNIDGEVVIVDPESSTMRILNKTASLIWSLADGTRQTEGIIAEVCRVFDVDEEQARADVDEFCRELLEAGLIGISESALEIDHTP